MPVVHRHERPLFLVSLVAGVAIPVALAVLDPESLAWVAGFLALSLVLHGWAMGQVRGNAVRVSERQLPALHRLAVDLSTALALSRVPAVYVLQQDDVLNAFAAKFVRRDVVVLSSDVADLAEEEGEPELAFVLAHELTHVKRRHPLWSWLLVGSRVVPLLGPAYSRACELTCDATAARLRPDGAPGGLLVLAAGRRLHWHVDAAAFADQVQAEAGFWVWLTELFSSHPRLPRRVAALRGAPVDAPAPVVVPQPA